MNAQDVTAIIVAGGRGQRMHPNAGPKCLSEIHGRPLLWYLLEYLRSYEIPRAVICTGYLAEQVEDFVRDYKGMLLETVNSGLDVGIARRLHDARKHVNSRHVLICYGDVLADVDVDGLLHAHDRLGQEATITIWPYRSQYGLVEVDSELEMVTGFSEKPELPYWINIGFLVLQRVVLDLAGGMDMVKFLSVLVARGMRPFVHRGRCVTIDTVKDLGEAERFVEEVHGAQGSGNGS